MHKKYFPPAAIIFLGIFPALFLGNINKANAAYIPPLNYNCVKNLGSTDWYECTGVTPNDCKGPFAFNDCYSSCNSAGGVTLTYEALSPDNSYCCDGAGWSECMIGGVKTTLGSGSAPPRFQWPWDDIGNSIQNLMTFLQGAWVVGVLSIITYVLLAIVTGISALLGQVLGWAMKDTLNIHIIPGGPNTVNIVNVGWTFTRDLVNMVFLLILVFIGLATILRLKQYEVKKILPMLVIAALLVNFSGVIVGVIVDISNLITNFFISKINIWDFGFKTLGDTGLALWGQISGFLMNMAADPSVYLASFVQPFAQMVITLNFFIILDCMLVAIIIIFILRTIYLWIFVILAPLAFAAYILPETKGFYSWWSKNVIQWAIVGIPISFFLYLATMILRIINAGEKFEGGFGNMGAETGWFGTLITSLLAPTTVVILLYVGIGISLTNLPGAAKKIMDGGQAASKIIGKTLGKWGVGGVRGLPAVTRAEEFTRKKLENIPYLGRAFGGPGAFEMAKRKKTSEAEKAIEQIPNNPEGNAAIRKRMRRLPLTDAGRRERVAAIETLAKRGELDLKEGTPKEKEETKKLLSEYMRAGGNPKSIYLARPDLAEHLGFKVDDEELDSAGKPKIDPATGKIIYKKDPKTGKNLQRKARPEEAIKAAINKFEPGEGWKTLQGEALENPEVAARLALDYRRMDQMGRNAKKENKLKFQKALQGISKVNPLTGDSVWSSLNAEEQKKLVENELKMRKEPNWN